MWDRVGEILSFSSSDSTVEMAPVRLTFFCVPYPTTTVASRLMASSERYTVIWSFLPESCTVLSTYPRQENVNECSSGPSLMENRPSASAETPCPALPVEYGYPRYGLASGIKHRTGYYAVSVPVRRGRIEDDLPPVYFITCGNR